MHTKLKMASYANEQQPLIAENSFIEQGEFEKMLSVVDLHAAVNISFVLKS